MAQRLQGAGAQAVAMPCNTAHHYADAIRAAVTVPFLDMVGLSVTEARRRTGARVGILASPALRMAGVFDAACAGTGLTPVYGADDGALLGLIRLVKREGATDAARAAFASLSRALGEPVQLIACTEFSLLAGVAPPDVVVIDTLDVLARAIIDFSTGAVHG